MSTTTRVGALTSCPACGIAFTLGAQIPSHLAEHAPEDFGLAPLGQGRTDGRSVVEVCGGAR
jgi:hypothetical protein